MPDGARTPTASTLEVWTVIESNIFTIVLPVAMVDRCLLGTSEVTEQRGEVVLELFRQELTFQQGGVLNLNPLVIPELV